jgi:hypothetical protein
MLRELDENEALCVVASLIRNLFPIVSERQSRELAQAVLRGLDVRDLVLATREPPGTDRPVPTVRTR